MAPKLQQKVLHLHQGLEHMICLDGTSRPLDAALSPGKHIGGLIVPLPETSRHNTGQGFVAVRQKHHQHLILPVQLIHHGCRLFNPLLGHVLALVIESL